MENKINMADQLSGFYGQHRSGWLYALKNLESLHNPDGIRLDSFIEQTFCWCPVGSKAHLEPWIGFVHIPPGVPRWFHYEQSLDFIFNSDAWKRSLPHCRGLFTLSFYLKKYLESRLDIPIGNVFFPTETPDLKWSWDSFLANRKKKIVQVGWWLRKLHTIFQLPGGKYRKIFLRINRFDLNRLIRRERLLLMKEGLFNNRMYETAETVIYIPDLEYDKLLSENIVILNLYDSSANNTIIECIVRNTPLLVNPLEPVIEYLGRDYPFYFSSLEEAARKAADFDLVYKTHRFLTDHPVKEKLAGEYFLRSFSNSEIYKSL